MVMGYGCAEPMGVSGRTSEARRGKITALNGGIRNTNCTGTGMKWLLLFMHPSDAADAAGLLG